MPAITDLTFQQMQTQLPTGSFTVIGGKTMLDVSAATGLEVDALADGGVIKLLTVLLNAGATAQTAANVGQQVGERLAAFGAVTSAVAVNGYVPVTRTFVSRSELATAVNIVGQVA